MNASGRACCAILGLVVWTHVASAQSDSVPATETMPIREWIVPLAAEGLSDLVDAGWVPLETKRFERLRALLESVETKADRGPHFGKAVFRAVYAEGELRSGRFEAVVAGARTPNGRRLMPLAPLDMAVRGLRWADGERAVWGTDGDGRIQLVVPPTGGVLVGEWSQRGRTRRAGVEFRLGLLPTSVSRLEIALPRDRRLTCSTGLVSAPQPGDSDPVWTVDVGAENPVTIRIVANETSPPDRTVVLHETSVRYVLRRSEARFRADVSLEVFGDDVNGVWIELPDDATVESVDYGDVTLDWRRMAGGLRIALPDPVHGRLRAIVVRGAVPIRVGRTWMIPNCEVRRVLGPGSARLLFGGGRLEADVAPPLVFSNVESHSCRRLGSPSDNEGDSLVFQRYDRKSSVRVVVAEPERDFRGTSFNLVDTTTDEWRLRSRVEWTARSGRAFRVRVRVPDGWQLALVAVPGEADAPDWTVQRRGDGPAVVVVDLGDGLVPGRSRALEFECRRLPVADASLVGAVAVSPLDCSSVDTHVVMRSPAGRVVESVSPTDFEAASTLDVEDVLAKFSEEAVPGQVLTGLESHVARPRGAIRLRDQTEALDARVSAELGSGANGTATVRYTIAVDPGRSSIDEVVVYSTDEEIDNWSLTDSPSSVVVPRRLDVTEREELGVPATGGSWVLRLPERRSEPFVLTSETACTWDDSGESVVPLVFVPAASRLGGEVRTDRGLSDAFELLATGPWSHDVGDTGSVGTDVGRSRYESTASRLALRRRSESDTFGNAPAVALQLTTTFDGSAEVVCEAEFTVAEGRLRESFEVQLPDGSKPEHCLVGSDSVVLREGPDGTLTIPVTSDRVVRRVVLRFRTTLEPTAGRLACRVSPPVPHCAIPVTSFLWTIRTATAVVPTGEPSGASWTEAVSEPSWLQRVFGPPGRSAGKDVFNPFLSRHWSPAADAKGSRAAWRDGTCRVFDVSRVPAVLLVDTRSRDSFAWTVFVVCALFGALTRQFELKSRILGGAVLVVIGLAGALLLPPALAPIGGSILAGTVLASLFPRPLLRRSERPERESSDVSSGSTQSFQQVVSAVVVALIVGRSLMPTSSMAQGRSAAAAEAVNVVVVPKGMNGRPAPVVYVTPGLAKRLANAERRAKREPTALVERARYKVHVPAQGPPTLFAGFTVRALDDADRILVRLPTGGATLGGDRACLVDGVETPIRRSRDGGALELELETGDDADRRSKFEVELRLHPRVDSASDGSHGFSVTVPPVSDSEVLVQTESGIRLLDPPKAAAIARRLGPVRRLDCRWSAAGELVVAESRGEIEVTSLVGVSPSLLQTRCRVRLRSSSSVAPERLRLRLPGVVGVRSITADVAVESAVERSSAGATVVDIGFPPHATADAERVVDVEFVSVPRRDGEEIVIPPIEFDTGPESDDELTVGAYTVAATCDSEFDLTRVPEVRAGDLPVVSVDGIDLGDDSGRSIELAFRGEEPAIARMQLDLRESTRRVRRTLDCRVSPTHLDWTFVAEVEIDGAAVFGHDLDLDESTVVRSVSVDQDGAERLQRWARRDDRLVLTLRERSAGRQRIVVTGRRPITVPGPVELPVLRFRDAAVTNATTVIRHVSTLDVALAADGGGDPPRRLQGPLDGSGSPDLLTFGRFAIDDVDRPTVLRVSRKPVVLEAEAVSFLEARSDRAGRLLTRVRVTAARGRVGSVAIDLPLGYPERYSLTTEPRARTLLAGRGRRKQLVISPNDADVETLSIELVADLNAPSKTTWSLALPSVRETPNRSGNHTLVLADDTWSAAGLPTEVADWAREGVTSAERSGVAVPATDVVALTRESRAEAREEGRIGILETRIVFTRDGIHGTTLVFPIGIRGDLEFDVPDGTRVREVTVDGRSQRDSETGLRVPLDSGDGDGLHVVRVAWTRPLTRAWLPVRRRIPFVRPSGWPIARESFSVSSRGLSWSTSQPMMSERETAGARLDGLLRLTESSMPDDRVVRTAIVREGQRWVARIAAEGRSRELDRARERLQLLAGRMGERVSASATEEDRVFGPRSSDGPGGVLSGAPGITVWTVGSSSLTTVVYLGILVLLVPVTRRFASLNVADWVHGHVPVSLAALGVVWWTCLQSGWIGAVLVLTAVVLWVRSIARGDGTSEMVV